MIEVKETIIQQHCVKWFRFQYPNLTLISIPNEGKRTFSNARRMVAEGMTKGASDLILLRPNKTKHGLLIELKTKIGKQSPEQKEFQKNVEAWNYQYTVCRSLDDFMKCVSDYIFDI